MQCRAPRSRDSDMIEIVGVLAIGMGIGAVGLCVHSLFGK